MAFAPSTTFLLQAVAIGSSFSLFGGNVVLSAFDMQTLSALPPSSSLPLLKFTFSRGSHTFPPVAFTSTALFSLLAYAARGSQRNVYIAAAVAAISIAPYTTRIMLPLANQKLLDMADAQRAGTNQDGNKGEMVDAMQRFASLNYGRAMLSGAAGVLGLWAASL